MLKSSLLRLFRELYLKVLNCKIDKRISYNTALHIRVLKKYTIEWMDFHTLIETIMDIFMTELSKLIILINEIILFNLFLRRNGEFG